MHKIPKLKWFSSRRAVVFAQSIEARCSVENEDVVGSWSSADRRSNYISVINNLIAYKCVTYIRDLTVVIV